MKKKKIKKERKTKAIVVKVGAISENISEWIVYLLSADKTTIWLQSVV